VKFDPEIWYSPDSAEMAQIAGKYTLANWRCQGLGPDYSKVGNRVLYRGADILAFLERKKVSLAEAA